MPLWPYVRLYFMFLLVFNGPTYVYDKFGRSFFLNSSARLIPHQMLNTINVSTKSFVEFFVQQYFMELMCFIEMLKGCVMLPTLKIPEIAKIT